MILYAHEKGHPVSMFTTGVGMTLKDFKRIQHIPWAGSTKWWIHTAYS